MSGVESENFYCFLGKYMIILKLMPATCFKKTEAGSTKGWGKKRIRQQVRFGIKRAQIMTFCFYLFFTQRPNSIFGNRVVPTLKNVLNKRTLDNEPDLLVGPAVVLESCILCSHKCLEKK